MSRLVPNDRIPVSLDDPITPESDVIYIKGRMDYGTKQRIMGAAFRDEGGNDKVEIRFDLGRGNLALLHEMVVDWSGPGFEGIPCTPENIERIPEDDPLLDKVLATINGARGKAKVESHPFESSGGLPSSEPAQLGPVNGTTTLSSWNGSAGPSTSSTVPIPTS